MIPRSVGSKQHTWPAPRVHACTRAYARETETEIGTSSHARVLEIPNSPTVAPRRARDVIMRVRSMQIALSNFAFASPSREFSVHPLCQFFSLSPPFPSPSSPLGAARPSGLQHRRNCAVSLQHRSTYCITRNCTLYKYLYKTDRGNSSRHCFARL